MCLAFTAQAEDASDKEIYELCAESSNAAKKIMIMRQKDVSIVALMEAMKNSSLGRDIVTHAYKERVWRTEDHKQRVINEFATKYYLECIKTYKGE